jgi:hypothetical protein
VEIFTLTRKGETAHSSWGVLQASDGALLCMILERGAHNRSHPRIDAGLYELAHKPLGASRFDAGFARLIGAGYKGVLWLPDVPGRSAIEIHTANFVRQLRGCLATGGRIVRDRDDDFAIAGGTSRPAYARLYPVMLAAIEKGGARLRVKDIIYPEPMPIA